MKKNIVWPCSPVSSRVPCSWWFWENWCQQRVKLDTVVAFPSHPRLLGLCQGRFVTTSCLAWLMMNTATILLFKPASWKRYLYSFYSLSLPFLCVFCFANMELYLSCSVMVAVAVHAEYSTYTGTYCKKPQSTCAVHALLAVHPSDGFSVLFCFFKAASSWVEPGQCSANGLFSSLQMHSCGSTNYQCYVCYCYLG